MSPKWLISLKMMQRQPPILEQTYICSIWVQVFQTGLIHESIGKFTLLTFFLPDILK